MFHDGTLEFDADSAARGGKNRTRLHQTLEGNHAKVARVLLENGALQMQCTRIQIQTQLHLASWDGYHYGVWLLLYHCADIHARDNEGRTPFQVASPHLHRHRHRHHHFPEHITGGT